MPRRRNARRDAYPDIEVFAGAIHEHVQPVVPAAERFREIADQGLGREVVVMSLLVVPRALR